MLKIDEIKELIQALDESSLTEFTYEFDNEKIALKKEVQYKEVQSAPAVSPVLEPKVTESTKVETHIQEESTQSEAQPEYDYEITSPMVGTFYLSSSPEADPYVEKGDKVSSQSVVCIIEAMKLFNEIEAEVDGEIVEILAEHGELVEYGQPLFGVKTK
ncbi:biotin carboxyl carrier protein [Pelagirhabdus alkalitolerans]|uniref:Biotin carboxyl carrier protein of acetyl-CoA carboxylase n=1 Tax=Pelagirhabdus alkalitolerans TaxID=1612202 RepID=A0A1G6I134_9BACI|nr:acetyl-CoA carboxylase biotin carboxyl carrier protein [Pelagirhabdus alkalitolerans]SDC00269.1 biotin carboxyl carrier protein [Pelagirhabdus alkalitolerans]